MREVLLISDNFLNDNRFFHKNQRKSEEKGFNDGKNQEIRQ